MGLEFKFILAALVFAFTRQLLVFYNPRQIEKKIVSIGGKYLEKEDFFEDRGWFARLTDRRYKVRYMYIDKKEHEAIVKIKLFSGVRILKDEVLK